MLPFWEEHPDYNVRVLNEREARAGAGLLFLGAAFSFSHAWFDGYFAFMQVFVSFFLIDFIIRVLVHPRFSPSLILARIIVQWQKPEYTWAPQKKFAWALGLGLSAFMFYRLILASAFWPINLAICILCLTLLFFEAAFGICIGCKMYALITKKKPQLCPGDVCSIQRKEPIQKISTLQYLIAVVAVLGVVFLLSRFM